LLMKLQGVLRGGIGVVSVATILLFYDVAKAFYFCI
jgi:hypothetical protein